MPVVRLAEARVEEQARALRAVLGIDWQYAPFTRCVLDDAPLVGAGLFLGAAALLAWGRLRALDTRATVPEREMELLRRIPFMQALSPMVLERLASRLIPVAASYGDVLVRQGDPGDRFYAIEEGKVRVSVQGRHIAQFGPSTYFGEIALLRNVVRTASVTALGPVKLQALERDEFLAAVTGSKPSAEAVEAEIVRRLEADAAAAGASGS